MSGASNKKHWERGSHSAALLKIASSQCVIKLTSFPSGFVSNSLDVKNPVKRRILEKYHYGKHVFCKKSRYKVQGSQMTIATRLQLEIEFLTHLLSWILGHHYSTSCCKEPLRYLE